ncbi:prolyl oligopeptidase family serine peptidase [Armatimonas rosea]|uniref:Putative peptidase n=1 Tax=Armatimonas rosea TaxID=685828 RepID=A0A7W9SQZ7_ARMRO|nr:prolyl oligopeptidase family serine peptidase [Armatimonas rosea]MBB6050413.1 putative peptidase [Armatimonas rosea]
MTTSSRYYLRGGALAAGALLLGTAAQAQDLLSPLLARTFVDSSGLNLPYRLYVPENYDPSQKYPLVLFLHGGGERGTDNVSPLLNEPFAQTFFSPEVQAAHPSFFLVPQCPLEIIGGDPQGEYWVNNFENYADGTPHPGFAWDSYLLADYPVSTSLRAVTNLLPALQSEFSIDSSRLYATGWSMGGDATWDLLMRNPGLFAAGAPIAGIGDPTQAASLASTPLWVFHGAQDTAALPSGSQQMVAAIQAAGGNIRYTEYADGTHYIGADAYSEAGFMDWLFAQSLPNTATPVPVPAPTPEPTLLPPPPLAPNPTPATPEPGPVAPNSVPEPGTLGLLALGLLVGRSRPRSAPGVAAEETETP